MESILSTIFYYVLVPLFILGIAINIHEFGHFIIAKMFGMRVEAYSFFGLGPRLFGFKRGHTDYRVSAIPLGAYVKLYGDEANNALEGADDSTDAVPASELYELRPRWQKFLVMIGGPFMNIMLALAIPFAGALMNGIPAMPAPIIGAVKADGAAAKSGVQVGDKIVAFNGKENPTWRQITLDAAVMPERPIPATVERGGQRVSIEITPTKEKVFGGQEVGILEAEPDSGVMPVVIGEVQPNTPAEESGMKAGDRIVSLNGAMIRNQQQLLMAVQENKAAPIKITIERDGKTQDLTTQVRKLDDGTERLGIKFARPELPLEPASVGTALTYAVDSNLENLRLTGTVLGQVFSGKRSVKDSGIGGPVGIFQQSAEATRLLGWEGLFAILGAISLSLGVFNLLPIPMLDGGQIFVLGIEKVLSWFGKTLSMVVRERIQLVGFAMIILLMFLTFFLDFSRIASNFGGSKPAAKGAKVN